MSPASPHRWRTAGATELAPTRRRGGTTCRRSTARTPVVPVNRGHHGSCDVQRLEDRPGVSSTTPAPGRPSSLAMTATARPRHNAVDAVTGLGDEQFPPHAEEGSRASAAPVPAVAVTRSTMQAWSLRRSEAALIEWIHRKGRERAPGQEVDEVVISRQNGAGLLTEDVAAAEADVRQGVELGEELRFTRRRWFNLRLDTGPTEAAS